METCYSAMSHFADAKKFLAVNQPSGLTKKQVLAMRGKYNIPNSGFPYPADTPCQEASQIDAIAIGQLDPISFLYINSFQHRCHFLWCVVYPIEPPWTSKGRRGKRPRRRPGSWVRRLVTFRMAPPKAPSARRLWCSTISKPSFGVTK